MNQQTIDINREYTTEESLEIIKQALQQLSLPFTHHMFFGKLLLNIAKAADITPQTGKSPKEVS